jgi:hypothetical protein
LYPHQQHKFLNLLFALYSEQDWASQESFLAAVRVQRSHTDYKIWKYFQKIAFLNIQVNILWLLCGLEIFFALPVFPVVVEYVVLSQKTNRYFDAVGVDIFLTN